MGTLKGGSIANLLAALFAVLKTDCNNRLARWDLVGHDPIQSERE